MVETNTKRPVLQDIAAAVLNLLTAISSLLFILKSRYQNSMLISSFLNKREPYWKKRFKQNHERRTRQKKEKPGTLKGEQTNGGKIWFLESYLGKAGKKILECLETNSNS